MFIGTRQEQHTDRMGRLFSHEVIKLKCDNCGRVWELRGSKTRIMSRKTHTCSKKCSHQARCYGGATQQVIAVTNLERYGVENPFAAEICKDKMKKTWLEKYGIEHARSSEVVKEKVKQTMLERYGVENAAQSPEILAKIRQTMLNRYGVEFPMQMQSTKDALMSGSIAKYGVPFVLQSELGIARMKRTCLEKYGDENFQNLQFVKDKIQQTCLERYGTTNVSRSEYFANLSFKHGCHKTGYVSVKNDLIWYRSSYEERFLKWCNTNEEIVCVRCNVPVEYNFEGKLRKYFIDFGVGYVDGRRVLYEIKSEYALTFPKNVAKFEAVRVKLAELGYNTFEVITEKNLEKLGA